MTVSASALLPASGARVSRRGLLLRAAIVLLVFVSYYFSAPTPYHSSDHTYRVARSLLHGELGPPQTPQHNLAEMIPLDDRYYSVFPFGSVATMLPLALLANTALISAYPALGLHASTAAMIALFLILIAARYPLSAGVQLTYVLYVLFGTWIWCCLIFLGPWQLNLGVSMVGQLGALYFSLVRFVPGLAGCFLALAFGHRTEIILIAPVFGYLIVREGLARALSRRQITVALAWFCAVPFLLGVLTLWYNFARFGSISDFGHERIPGVLGNYAYRHGIMALSLEYIQHNAYVSLLQGWRCIGQLPYIVPEGFGGSIFLHSPFLLLIFRWRSLSRELKLVSVVSIMALTLSLWTHGEPGGWQFSYRYASILIPWFFLILLDSSKNRLSMVSWLLLAVSIAMHAYGTYLFHWTDYVGIPGGPENPCPFPLLRDSWLFH